MVQGISTVHLAAESETLQRVTIEGGDEDFFRGSVFSLSGIPSLGFRSIPPRFLAVRGPHCRLNSMVPIRLDLTFLTGSFLG